MEELKIQKTVYDNAQHIKELLKEIISQHKENGYDDFEKISKFVREKNTKLDNFQYINNKKNVKKSFIQTPQEEKAFKTLSNTETKINLSNNYIEDILQHSKLFEWGGVSFNDEEWYKIRMALKKLSKINDCEYIRFFGKIYGIKSDYYIIQGLPRKYPMKNPQIHIESHGNEGINRYTFWVSNSILEIWHELPDITNEQIIISKRFKYIFTGELNSKVKSFILFPGKEMHLLKCQIIRILHSSNIVPKGFYKISENYKEQLESKIIELDEEFKSPSFDELKTNEGENWVHEYAYIYPNGKVIDPKIENQIERLKSINEDEGYKIKEGEGDNINEIELKYWKIKTVGDLISHNRNNADPISHGIIIIKNKRWPGTLTVWKESIFANIYVGYGIKSINENYYPTQLNKIDKDPDELEEQKEPFPEKEPVKEKKDENNEEEKKDENKEEEKKD